MRNTAKGKYNDFFDDKNSGDYMEKITFACDLYSDHVAQESGE